MEKKLLLSHVPIKLPFCTTLGLVSAFLRPGQEVSKKNPVFKLINQ